MRQEREGSVDWRVSTIIITPHLCLLVVLYRLDIGQARAADKFSV